MRESGSPKSHQIFSLKHVVQISEPGNVRERPVFRCFPGAPDGARRLFPIKSVIKSKVREGATLQTEGPGLLQGPARQRIRRRARNTSWLRQVAPRGDKVSLKLCDIF
jgi:hypothetical protein